MHRTEIVMLNQFLDSQCQNWKRSWFFVNRRMLKGQFFIRIPAVPGPVEAPTHSDFRIESTRFNAPKTVTSQIIEISVYEKQQTCKTIDSYLTILQKLGQKLHYSTGTASWDFFLVEQDTATSSGIQKKICFLNLTNSTGNGTGTGFGNSSYLRSVPVF